MAARLELHAGRTALRAGSCRARRAAVVCIARNLVGPMAVLDRTWGRCGTLHGCRAAQWRRAPADLHGMGRQAGAGHCRLAALIGRRCDRRNPVTATGGHRCSPPAEPLLYHNYAGLPPPRGHPRWASGAMHEDGEAQRRSDSSTDMVPRAPAPVALPAGPAARHVPAAATSKVVPQQRRQWRRAARAGQAAAAAAAAAPVAAEDKWIERALEAVAPDAAGLPQP